ncbi:intraflagellar transport protein 46 homolog [Apteryx rowi]|uniref:intraflagellar transport protein 46 homolog n=1 Tax=Apteryx rowi TaxID=308060 RepID=UPI000E1D809A|nr:intraflagellar transport protein 46 homolog [Apteryx rowi]XP_025913665.1 intraflagellar transport protein 46 homolog [Apteryx rowi]
MQKRTPKPLTAGLKVSVSCIVAKPLPLSITPDQCLTLKLSCRNGYQNLKSSWERGQGSSLMPEFPATAQVGLPTAEINCGLAEYIDMICAILDIPVYKSRIQPLHVLFSLYSEFKNSQHFKSLAEGKKARSPPSNLPSQAAEAEVLSFT